MSLTLTHAKVIVPSAEDRVDLADDLLQAQVITSAYLESDLLFE